jgi:hypothetical protein
MAALILKRASATHPFGQWRGDNYDVLSEGPLPLPPGLHLPTRNSFNASVNWFTHSRPNAS